MLRRLKKETMAAAPPEAPPEAPHFGILSHHPAAIMAACRAFGHGINNIDIDFILDTAGSMMWNCPVKYVHAAAMSAFFKELRRDSCSCFTHLYIDHTETKQVLEELRNHPSPVSQERVVWRLGDLPERYDFLALFKPD